MSSNAHRARALALSIAAAVVIADRLTKLAIQDRFSDFDVVNVFPGWLRIIYTTNPGAAFGVLASGSPVLRSIVLIGISSLVLAFVAAALWKSNPGQPASTRIGLSLILGGAFGNLYDRIVHGTVTDFIEVYHGAWSFPAFNVADSAITVGAILLLWDFVRPKREHPVYTKDVPQAH